MVHAAGLFLLLMAAGLLNQACAWFLRIVSVGMYVCVSAPEAINN